MTHVDEIRIDMKARNNRLIKLREDLGMSQAQAAAVCGVTPSILGQYENLKVSPIGRRGWNRTAKRIAAYYGEDKEYIWSEQVRELRARMVTRTISTEKAMQWDGWGASKPMLTAAASEATDVIETAFSKVLSEREAMILRELNSAAEPSLEDVAAKLQITRERVRQIEMRALHKLRRSHRLDDYADGVV